MNIDMHNPISYTDIRLLRRIVRDKKYRASAERTFEMWHSVRRGEFKWIYPFQEGCNYVYNSALTYEPCVLKKYALPALKEVPSDSVFYITANRLIKFLKYFKDMDDKWVPCKSLLREFIGGSCFAEVDEQQHTQQKGRLQHFAIVLWCFCGTKRFNSRQATSIPYRKSIGLPGCT